MKTRPKTTITPLEALEIGHEMMMLKATVAHGEFIPRLDLLGYSHSESNRFMKAARKFHGASNAKLLEAVDTVSKLNELLTLEDDEIDTLKAGGEVHGLTLHSLKFMTVKQIRAAIRGRSILGNQESLSNIEASFLGQFRESARTAQDVSDKNALLMALEIDLLINLSTVAPQEIPCATGFHVAALQLVNPIGTWRMACPHVNQGTRYSTVTFRPAPARTCYRARP